MVSYLFPGLSVVSVKLKEENEEMKTEPLEYNLT
jgi:hypothetical protein